MAKKSQKDFKDRVSSITADTITKAYSIASRIPVINKVVHSLVSFVYSVYEKILENQISKGPIPQHIAIIPDGNRRWAKKVGLDVKYGHIQGYERMREVLSWLYDLGIRVVTVYAMSNENCLHRPLEERKNLFNIIKRGLEELLESDVLHKYKVRVRVIGRLELVPEDLRELAKEVEEKSRNYSERFLNIALCYGGRQEIVDAIKAIVKDILDKKISIDDINEDLVAKYLGTSHLNEYAEPDLVIRTSGEMRISNFLLWQIAYSELYFCDVLWPEIRRIDILRAIRSYQRRERRFGR